MNLNLTSTPWNDEPANCPWCAYSTNSGLPVLTAHISAIHLSYFPFGCASCGHWLSSEAMLKYHCELTAHPYQPKENRDPDKEQRLLEVMKVLMEKPTPTKVKKRTPKKPTPKKLLKSALSKIVKSTPMKMVTPKPTPSKNMATPKPTPSRKKKADEEYDYDSDETGISTATGKSGKWKFMSKTLAESMKNKREKRVKEEYDSDETGVSTMSTTKKEKFRCNKCTRPITMNGAIKHVWRHLADEGLHVFVCTSGGCTFTTFRLANALFHHRVTHKNDDNARILDHRADTKQLFEERLADWFDFDNETVQKLSAMQND